jgi:hypothetical protein
MHAFKDKAVGPINQVQRIGALAIVETFLTVATSMAEAEAHIATAHSRLWRRAVKMWTDIHTLPETDPLREIQLVSRNSEDSTVHRYTRWQTR